jgi:hypothetical protein
MGSMHFTYNGKGVPIEPHKMAETKLKKTLIS